MTMNRTEALLKRREFIAHMASGVVAVAGCAGTGWWLATGQAERPASCLRPPGALPEPDFLAACIRCGRCIDACPNRCILAFTREVGKEVSTPPGPGQVNTPVIIPRRQACILCNTAPGEDLLCTASCPSGALIRTQKDVASIRQSVKMGTAEVDQHLCYSFNGASCGACVRACPPGRACP